MMNCLRDIFFCANPKTKQPPPVLESQQAISQVRRVLPHADIVKLFTDVAGLTRQRSQFKIYPNYCYIIKADTKKLVIDILPPRQVEKTAIEKTLPLNTRSYMKTSKTQVMSV